MQPDKRGSPEEARLGSVEHQFQLLLEAATDQTLFLLDKQGCVASWNASAARLLGFAEPEILGQSFALLCPPEEAGPSQTHKPEAPAPGSAQPGAGASGLCGPESQRPGSPQERDARTDRWLMRKDGSRLWVSETTTVLRDSTGVCGFAKVIRDRTDQRQTEETLHREREFLRAVLESIQEAVVACDAAGNLTFVNHFTRELEEPASHSSTPAESSTPVVARSGDRATTAADWTRHFTLYHPDKTPLAEDEFPLFRALRGERVRDVELVLVPAHGPAHVVLASGQPLLDAQGNKLGAVLALHDVTQRRRLEKQFQHAQKMEAIGRLASGISHDFNNHLTIINGYGDMLLRTLPADNQARELVAEMTQAGSRATLLVRQLLAFSRQQTLSPEVLDLNAILLDLEKMLRRVIGEDIQLATNLQPTLGWVKIDPGHIEQVVLNLVNNARDAMPRGGKLTLETRNVRLDESYCSRHPHVRPGPYVLLAVSDTGSGMTEDVKARLFEPFFTTKEKGKGSGLGLAMAYGVVKQSSGQIEVYSEPGLGSTFKIYLPRVKGAIPGGKSWHGHPPAQHGTETVLLVEDEDSVLSMSRVALQEHGYSVLEARNGVEALAVARQHKGPIHVLVSDVVLPQLAGPPLAKQLLPLFPEMKVLFISGYPDEAVVRHGVLREEGNFLQKPFSPVGLAHKVREVLDS